MRGEELNISQIDMPYLLLHYITPISVNGMGNMSGSSTMKGDKLKIMP